MPKNKLTKNIFLILTCGIIFFILLSAVVIYLHDKSKSLIENKETVNKKIENETPKTKLEILADSYYNETEQKIERLDLSLRQKNDLKFIESEKMFTGEIAAENTKYPSIDCGDETIELAYIPDPYRKDAEEIVIFEDALGIKAVNKQNGKVIQSKKGFNLQQLSKIKYNNVDYYLTEEYSGGAHCCFEQRVISCSNGKAKIGDEVNFGNSAGYSDLFIKNKQIYYRKYDRRFDYFNFSYAESGGMTFPAFYKYDSTGNKFINASKEFPDYYREFGKQQNEWVSKLKKYNTNFFDGDEELWFYPLLLRLTSNYLSGENNKVIKDEFTQDFSYFISSPYKEKDFLFPLTADDAKKVFDDAIKILSN
jgi:hypothetical protein